MVVRQVGAEPSSPCAQLEHLADLLRKRLNGLQNPILYEVWRPKIVEDIEKQMVRTLCWDSKVPEICTGTQAAVAPCLPQDTARRVRLPAPSPTTAERAAQYQEGSGCWKLLGIIERKWETHKGGLDPLVLWTLGRSLPEKLGSWTTLGEGRSVGLCEKLGAC